MKRGNMSDYVSLIDKDKPESNSSQFLNISYLLV